MKQQIIFSKSKWYLYILLLIFCLSASCNQQRNEAEKIVKKWMGKTIVYPNDVLCSYLLNDSISTDCHTGKPFKILLYTDSIGCVSCNLRLTDWKDIINEADSLFPDKVDFLFYFHPSNVKEIKFLFKRDHFYYPVFMDTENKINKLNNFPSNISYQCFLLNAENEVISIGNPTLNPGIWNFYKEIISGKKETDANKLTTVSIPQTSMKLNDLSLHAKKTVVFAIKNTGNEPLIINGIKSSCGCAVPSWEKRPVKSGDETLIIVEVAPEESGYFDKNIKVFCNTDDSPIVLNINGNVEK